MSGARNRLRAWVTLVTCPLLTLLGAPRAPAAEHLTAAQVYVRARE